MNLPSFFSLRFKTRLAEMDFFAEVECENMDEARVAFQRSQGQHQEIELVAAMIGFHLAKPNGLGCHLLDDESEKLFVQVLKDLRLGAEHYYNERMGSYDNINNRITPADLGIVFPDGTLRVVWNQESATTDFDMSLDIAKGALELLLQAQELTYFQQSEDELDENDFESLSNRRVDLLFKAGLWPSSDGQFDPELPATVQALLAEHAEPTAAAVV